MLLIIHSTYHIIGHMHYTSQSLVFTFIVVGKKLKMYQKYTCMFFSHSLGNKLQNTSNLSQKPTNRQIIATKLVILHHLKLEQLACCEKSNTYYNHKNITTIELFVNIFATERADIGGVPIYTTKRLSKTKFYQSCDFQFFIR